MRPASQSQNILDHLSNRRPPKSLGWLAILPLLAILLIAFTQPGMAASAPADLSGYEQALFGQVYPDEAASQRLARLESFVFGGAQPGNEDERRARLASLLAKTTRSGPDVASQPNAQASSFPSQSLPPLSSEPARPAAPPDATDYPTVTAMEREAFGRDFTRENIRQRLDRLETQTFGASDPAAALVDRVDRLLSRYSGVSGADPVGNASGVEKLSIPSEDAGRNRDIHLKVDSLERALLNGQTHPNQLLSERLDRLERQSYGVTYAQESPDVRLNRLLGGFRVGSSQVGAQPRPAFQSPPPFQPAPFSQNGYPPANGGNYRAASPPTPQNIQIGGGMSMSQNSTYHFSPELLSMLPPDAQAQLGGGNAAGLSGAPGRPPATGLPPSNIPTGAPPGVTIVEEWSQDTNTGFQPFGMAPVPYNNPYYNNPYNPYGMPGAYMPGMQTQSGSRTTTVIQPNGGNVVYRFSNAPAFPPTPYAYPTVNPVLLQSLNALEQRTFGRINPGEPVPTRLARLESAILGQTYAGYPDNQRLFRLQNAHPH